LMALTVRAPKATTVTAIENQNKTSGTSIFILEYTRM
jgi:hypothetical protein